MRKEPHNTHIPYSACVDFEDMSCEMIYGQKPLPLEEDTSLQQPCYASMCKSICFAFVLRLKNRSCSQNSTPPWLLWKWWHLHLISVISKTSLLLVMQVLQSDLFVSLSSLKPNPSCSNRAILQFNGTFSQELVDLLTTTSMSSKFLVHAWR